jgi:hypothetical protein
VYFHDLVVGSSGKTTELTRANRYTLSFNIHDDTSLEDQKTFVTFLMSVGKWIGPTIFCVEIADLQTI